MEVFISRAKVFVGYITQRWNTELIILPRAFVKQVVSNRFTLLV